MELCIFIIHAFFVIIIYFQMNGLKDKFPTFLLKGRLMKHGFDLMGLQKNRYKAVNGGNLCYPNKIFSIKRMRIED